MAHQLMGSCSWMSKDEEEEEEEKEHLDCNDDVQWSFKLHLQLFAVPKAPCQNFPFLSQSYRQMLDFVFLTQYMLTHSKN